MVDFHAAEQGGSRCWAAAPEQVLQQVRAAARTGRVGIAAEAVIPVGARVLLPALEPAGFHAEVAAPVVPAGLELDGFQVEQRALRWRGDWLHVPEAAIAQPEPDEQWVESRPCAVQAAGAQQDEFRSPGGWLSLDEKVRVAPFLIL